MVELASIECAIIRGGTSKGVFVRGADLPESKDAQDTLFRHLMGSPDPRQIDGLGGADPLTSKLVAVYSSGESTHDIEYETIEVGVRDPVVNRGIMCGNLSSGVGYFALLENLVGARDGVTVVRMLCRSNGKLVIARIPTPGGLATSAGPFELRGVPGTGAEVQLEFCDPVGTVSDRELPLDEPRIELTGAVAKELSCSLVDAGALYAFFLASDFGLSGHESALELDARPELFDAMASARQRATDLLSERLGVRLAPRRLKCAVVAPSQDREATLSARIINPERAHKAYAVGGAVATASAALLEGTVVQQVAGPIADGKVSIAHPSGVLHLRVDEAEGPNRIRSVTVSRTARVLMRGVAYLPL